MEATANASSSYLLLLSSELTRKRAKSITPKASSSEKIEIRVCTNRTCRKQGSLDILQVLSGIVPPFVTVNSCGCLGLCGSGPNIVALPGSVFVRHCGTPSKAADVMSALCGVDDVGGGVKCLEALALRKRAEDEMDSSQAYRFLTEAIELKPFGGLHIIYKQRSVVRLAIGDISGALEDSEEALTLAPDYPEAYVCKGDVYMAMNQFNAAEESYAIAVDLDPSIRRSKSFKARIAKLQEKLAPTPADLG